METQVPQWGEANRPRVFEFPRLLDRELKNRSFIAGDHYTVATSRRWSRSISCARQTDLPEEFINLPPLHGTSRRAAERDA